MAQDSLAGESILEGGSFGANADARGPMDQKAAGLTANTTDTSGATRLDPAVDAEARAASEEWSESASLSAGRNLSSETTTGTATSHLVSGADIADTTNQASTGAAIPPSVAGGPKGKNVTEGGFDGNEREAKFDVEPGSKEDVGRHAFQPDVGVAGGEGPRQGQVSGDGQFDGLRDAQA